MSTQNLLLISLSTEEYWHGLQRRYEPYYMQPIRNLNSSGFLFQKCFNGLEFFFGSGLEPSRVMHDQIWPTLESDLLPAVVDPSCSI